MPTHRVCGLAPLALLAACAAPPPATPTERAEVLTTIDRFFAAMSARDAAASRTVLADTARFFSIREVGGHQVVRATSDADYLASLEGPGPAVLERLVDPVVLVDGRVATVHSSYEFLRDGAPSHTGVDSFGLLRTDAGWVITTATYTVLPVAR